MKPVCDFCSDTRVVHRYQADDFVLAEDKPVMTEWCACKECVELITQDKWNELANRAAHMFQLKHWAVDDYLFKEIIRSHALFRLHRKPER